MHRRNLLAETEKKLKAAEKLLKIPEKNKNPNFNQISPLQIIKNNHIPRVVLRNLPYFFRAEVPFSTPSNT